VHRLEEVRLPFSVRADEGGDAGVEVERRALVAAEVLERELGDPHDDCQARLGFAQPKPQGPC
jgi:hypothetical protein